MASIVATPLPALGVVKIIVDWTPISSSDGIFVYRRTPDGQLHEVIGSPVFLSGGYAILYDSTAPFDVPMTYRAFLYDPTVVIDNFSRSTVAGWGTPDVGVGPYVVREGTAANFNTFISAKQGQITSTATNVPQIISLPTAYTNTIIEATVSAPTVTTGAIVVSTIYTRYTNSLNFYAFALGWMTDGTVTARVYRRQTSPSTLVLLDSKEIGTYTFGQRYRMVVRNSGTSLQFTAWTGRRPSTVTLNLNDSVQTGAGYPAFGVTATTGFTGTLPFSLAFENISVRNLATFELNSSTVTLVAGRDGWIRDPQNPPASVRLDNCASHTLECLDADRFVFFQGMDDTAYASATGVFDVIDAENPLTVAQTRKSAETGLKVVSTTLADIPPLKRLFSTGRDLLVSLPADYGWGIESYNTEPVSVGDVQVTRLNRRDMRKPQRLWNLPVRVVDPDETYPTRAVGSNNIPVTGATFGDMKATGLTYAQLKAGGKTYLDWAQGDFT